MCVRSQASDCRAWCQHTERYSAPLLAYFLLSWIPALSWGIDKSILNNARLRLCRFSPWWQWSLCFMSVILIFDVKKVFNDRSNGRIVKTKHIIRVKNFLQRIKALLFRASYNSRGLVSYSNWNHLICSNRNHVRNPVIYYYIIILYYYYCM